MYTKFSLHIHNLISENFSKTYFVGGAVRNKLLRKKVIDADIATQATPKDVVALLKQNKISYSDEHKKLGVVIAKKGKEKVEITTFRKETYSKSRFPKVSFIESPKTDSNRRDFTVNALYYNPITKEVLDFHEGLNDIATRTLKFIGNPTKRIKEDPLRIVRAYRFQLQYDLKLDDKTHNALLDNKDLLKTISATRVQKEINAIKTKSLQQTLQKVIHSIS